MPTAVPSTSTCTLPIAAPTVEVLSMAQPATVAVPETVAPEAGISMCTDGIMAAQVSDWGAPILVLVCEILNEIDCAAPSLSEFGVV
jgi:hypothetical protein